MRAAVALLAVVLAGESEAPAAPRAAETFVVEGVRVVHELRPGAGVVSARLVLLGGARQVTSATAGIEPLLLRASAWGTRAFPGRSAREAEMVTGSALWVSEAPDWTIFGFEARAEAFDETWALFADRVVHPDPDPVGFQLERERMVAAVRALDENPDAAVQALAAELAFRDHPYAVPVEGTPGSLAALELDDLQRYHAEQVVRSRLLLVVVGEVARTTVEAAVRTTLAELPAGDYEWTPPPPWSAGRPEVAARQRTLPTNYVLGYFSGPPAGAPDHLAFRMAVQTLSSFLFMSLREDAGLTYAAGAPFVDLAASGGGIYVTTRDPRRAVDLVNDAIEALSSGVFRRNVIQRAAGEAALGYRMMNEVTPQRADFLTRSWLLDGELVDAEGYVARLRSVEPSDIRRAAVDYFRNVRYAFLGDTTLVPRGLMTRH